MTAGNPSDRMFADSSQAEPERAVYVPLPMDTYVPAGERLGQAWDELRTLSREGGDDKARQAQLLLWEIGMLTTLRGMENAIPAEIRAEREPAIQAMREEQAARASQAKPLSWAEWHANRETRLRESSDWEAEMADLFAKTRLHIPLDVQEERDRALNKRYAARRAERARIEAEWRDRNAAA